MSALFRLTGIVRSGGGKSVLTIYDCELVFNIAQIELFPKILETTCKIYVFRQILPQYTNYLVIIIHVLYSYIYCYRSISIESRSISSQGNDIIKM